MALVGILIDLGLTRYEDKLREEAVDVHALMLLGAADLRTIIGIPLGHSAKLIERAAKHTEESHMDKREKPPPLYHPNVKNHKPIAKPESLSIAPNLTLIQSQIIAPNVTHGTFVGTVAVRGSMQETDEKQNGKAIELTVDSADTFDEKERRAIPATAAANGDVAPTGDEDQDICPSVENLNRSPVVRFCKSMGYMFTMLGPWDLLVPGDHCWLFKVAIIAAQGNDDVKMHFMGVAEMWAITFAVLFSALIGMWAMAPNTGVSTNDLMVFEAMVQIAAVLMLACMLLWSIIVVVTSSVHPRNIKPFLVAIAGQIQFAEVLLILNFYSFFGTLAFLGFLRMRILSPNMAWIPYAIIVFYVLIFSIVVGCVTAISKLALHSGLMRPVPLVASEEDEVFKETGDMFQCAWRNARKHKTVGATLKLHGLGNDDVDEQGGRRARRPTGMAGRARKRMSAVAMFAPIHQDQHFR